jgi:cytochrome P450
MIYDPFDALTHDDPYPTFERLRNDHPAYYNPELDFWALSRFEDVQSAARDWGSFTSREGVNLDETTDLLGLGDFVNMDPPRHDVLRNVVHDWFTPKNIAALRGRIQSVTDGLINQLRDKKAADLASALALPLPMHMINEILGLPSDDVVLMENWFKRLMNRTPGERQIPADAWSAKAEIETYLWRYIRRAVQKPRNDVLSRLAESVQSGRMLADEVIGMCLLLFIAGVHTTSGLISNSLWLLTQHPDQRHLLVEDSGRLPAAIEELLRFESPIQWAGRVATRDIDLHGKTIPRGSRVILILASANRDSSVYPNPDRLDLLRSPRRSLAFGEGIHFCIGAPLARLEGRIALQSLLAVFPNYTLSGPIQRFYTPGERGLARLPVELQSG